MPFSKPLIPERMAVGRATYNLRHFAKQVDAMDIPEPFKAALIQRIRDTADFIRGAVVDYDDDGSILFDSPDNIDILGVEGMLEFKRQQLEQK